MQDNFIKRIINKPPILFPWVALFHLFILGYSAWNFRDFPFPSQEWMPVLWLLVYFVLWLLVCDLKKWAGMVYVLLTALNIGLHYLLKHPSDVAVYTPPFLIIYILFSFFILFYYRRLK